MIIQWIKSLLYRVIVASRIVYYIFPIPIVRRNIHARFIRESNYKITDKDGLSLDAVRVRGRIYPPFGVERYTTGIKAINIRDDDVILCGYPKTGCHWMYEILQMLVNRKVQLSKYGKSLAFIDLMPAILLDSLPSPRVLNSHLLYEELPREAYEKKSKIILTVRSPKDVLVSYYNHSKVDFAYKGQFDNFADLFINHEVFYGTYFSHVSDWGSVMKKGADNPILMVEYEKLKSSPVQMVKKIVQFLDINVSDQFMEEVVETCDFANMKKARSTTRSADFFRKGVVGDWKNWLTDEQSAAIEEKCRQTLADCVYQPPL